MNRLRDWMLDDLVHFTGQSHDKTVLLMKDSWAMNDLAWRKADTRTPSKRKLFYEENKTYLYELARWNTEEWRWMWTVRIADYAAIQAVETVVDVGGGIGTDIMAVLLRVPGSKGALIELNAACREFAEFRAKRYNLTKRLAIFHPDEVGAYTPRDLTICMDVLEHVEDPLDTFEPLVEMSRHLAVNFCGNFKDKDFPMHLPKNEAVRGDYLRILRGIDPAYINPDEVYVGAGLRFGGPRK